MTDNFGIGTGRNSYSGMSGLADSKVSETERQARGAVEGRWPGGRTVIRVVVFALGALVIVGWVLSAINS